MSVGSVPLIFKKIPRFYPEKYPFLLPAEQNGNPCLFNSFKFWRPFALSKMMGFDVFVKRIQNALEI